MSLENETIDGGSYHSYDPTITISVKEKKKILILMMT